MKKSYALLMESARQFMGWNGPTEVARKLTERGYPVTEQTMTNWKSRGVSKAAQIEIAKIIGVSIDAFSIGTTTARPSLLPSSNTKLHADGAESEPSNLEQAPALRGKVPLISFVQAGDFSEVIDNLHPGDGDGWIDATCPVNRYTFALRVVGDSMEPDFPAGMILIIEPELSPEQNDFVIAKNGDGEATFKQLTRDGDDWYLKPLNPRYPIKPLGSSRIIGVVRDAVRKFR